MSLKLVQILSINIITLQLLFLRAKQSQISEYYMQFSIDHSVILQSLFFWSIYRVKCKSLFNLTEVFMCVNRVGLLEGHYL